MIYFYWRTYQTHSIFGNNQSTMARLFGCSRKTSIRVTTGWTALPPVRCKRPRINSSFGTSIWISCDTDIHTGMVEYDCITNSLKPAIPFKWTAAPVFTHPDLSCDYSANQIALVFHVGIVMFNLTTKQYNERILIPFDSLYKSCIAVGDYIHLFAGELDRRNGYAIFSRKDQTTTKFNDRSCPGHCMFAAVLKRVKIKSHEEKLKLISGVARIHAKREIPDVMIWMICKYVSTTEFYKFGGADFRPYSYLGLFCIGHLPNDDPSQPIQWTEIPEFCLHGHGLGSGVVQKDCYIVTFGGRGELCRELSDEIWILNVDAQEQWKLSPMKCPERSGFVAVLDYQQNVHLFSWGLMEKNTHHCIPIDVIIASVERRQRSNRDVSQIPLRKRS